MMNILSKYKEIRSEVSDDVKILVVIKSRSKAEVLEAISAGVKDIGGNYVRESLNLYSELGDVAKSINWHLIGHLQRNKVNNVLGVFDVVQTLDSLKLARALDSRVKEVLPVFIEVNIAGEESKNGVEFSKVMEFIVSLSEFSNLKIQGLMCVEPRVDNPREYFKSMKELFEECKSIEQDNLNLKFLSMGMSNSYKIAIEEGSNMIRIGSSIFGERR